MQVLIYLNTLGDEQGGGTSFPFTDLTVQPQAAMAVVFSGACMHCSHQPAVSSVEGSVCDRCWHHRDRRRRDMRCEVLLARVFSPCFVSTAEHHLCMHHLCMHHLCMRAQVAAPRNAIARSHREARCAEVVSAAHTYTHLLTADG